METQDKQANILLIRGVLVIALALMVTGTVYGVKYLLRDDGRHRQRRIQMVTVVKPPPPPKMKEKPPEPEVKKQEEILETEPEDQPPEASEDQPPDDTPPGEDLGLDAEGSAGTDGFGLRANKGGRALIGGGGNSVTLMHRYAWYTRIIQDELRKQMNRHMEENGGIPDGNLKALIQIEIDNFGKIVDYQLAKSSGDRKMDDAVINALKLASISEPPPRGMPRIIKLKISAKG
ncbi:TonB family protein [Desulfosarcina cetonica]|uniref:TonB family protein n=1 Tax=Desulfosarcina cetonica TaxID=90730 RepID=UPI0006D0FB31|nr:TonB family protein [Desulfosarcina cetonica]